MSSPNTGRPLHGERERSRPRPSDVALSVACLAVLGAVFLVPPPVLSSLTRSPVGPLFGAVVWLVPFVLGVLTLSRVVSTGRGVGSYVPGALGIGTIAIVLLNLRTVLTTTGMLTYGGQGAFYGPLLALLSGSALAVGVLTGAWRRLRSDVG